MNSLRDLLEEAGVSFDKIKGSTKRAEVLEALAKRAKVEADVVQVAMWETEWDELMEEKEEEPKIEFTDPVKGSLLQFMSHGTGPRGMCYAVNGEARPPFYCIRVSVHSRGPRLEFPELSTAATIPWGQEAEVLRRLRGMAEDRQVSHNIPEDGVLVMPQKKPSRQQPSPPPPPQVPSPSPPPHRKTIVYVENEFVQVKPGWISSLVSATYGDGYRNVSCLQGVGGLLQHGGLSFQVSAQALGVPDPSPGGAKKLEITFVPTHTQNVSPQFGTVAPPPPPIETVDCGVVIQDEEEEVLTERSNASYRHDPYNATTNSCTDDVSDVSTYDDSRRSDRDEDLSRFAIPPTRPNRANVSAGFGEVLRVSPGTIARIVRAVYGEGDRWVLATKVVKKHLVNGGISGLCINEEALEVQDPSPAGPKRLVVIYRPVDPMLSPSGYLTMTRQPSAPTEEVVR